MFTDPSKQAIIMGAEPAGLTAAYQLIKRRIDRTGEDQEYHEEMTSNEESSQARALAATQPLVLERIKEAVFL